VKKIVLLFLLLLTAAARCWNAGDVFVAGRTFFIDADCYSRMTRVRQVVEHPGRPVRRHQFENWPEGIEPHTTAPFDYLTASLAVGLRAVPGMELQRAIDGAGTLVSPLLGVLIAAFLWVWAGRLELPCRVPMIVLFATSPILVHGTVLGRPDHQSMLLLCMAVALGAEAALLNKPKRGWAATAGLAWGLGLWVSLYEPTVLLIATGVFSTAMRWFGSRNGATARQRAECARIRLLALLGVAFLAACIDGWRLPVQSREVLEFFPNWSRTIGELAHISPWSPVLPRWTLSLLPLSPVLLALSALRGGLRRQSWVQWGPGERVEERPADGAAVDRRGWFWLGLLALTLGLTCWQARWGYFFALVFTMALPWQLAVFPRRWMILPIFVLGLWSSACEWQERLFPSDAELTRRAEERSDNLALYDVAQQLRGAHTLPILAPWWQSPALAYWSDQPCVAGSSHESLPGIVDTCRFFVCEDSRASEAILARREVACVVAYDPARVMETSRAVLGIKTGDSSHSVPLGDADEKPMGVLLFRRPHSCPPFLKPVYGNQAFRVFLRPAGLTSAALPPCTGWPSSVAMLSPITLAAEGLNTVTVEIPERRARDKFLPADRNHREVCVYRGIYTD